MKFFLFLVAAMVASSFAASIRAKREYIGNQIPGPFLAMSTMSMDQGGPGWTRADSLSRAADNLFGLADLDF